MLQGVLTNAQRHEQMAMAKSAKCPMLKKKKHFNSKWASVVCYGPSLKDTWHLIKRPMVTVSGAHDFMVSKGVIPDYHIDCDPRAHKAQMLAKPQKSTSYLMASVCHPSWWPLLKGHNVRLWHLINGNDLETVEWVFKHDPDGIDCMISGGSSVGMRAMEVMAALGFRRFRFYGMDCSYTDQRHAGDHLGHEQKPILVKAGERVFKTTKQMLEAAIEMEKFIETQDAEVAFFGDGLMQETALQLKGLVCKTK